MTSHRGTVRTRPDLASIATLVVAVLAVLGIGAGAGITAWQVANPPRTVTRTRVVHRVRELQVPEPLTGCEQQLRADLAAVYPWMAAHRWATPTAAHGWTPDESACRH